MLHIKIIKNGSQKEDKVNLKGIKLLYKEYIAFYRQRSIVYKFIVNKINK